MVEQDKLFTAPFNGQHVTLAIPLNPNSLPYSPLISRSIAPNLAKAKA